MGFEKYQEIPIKPGFEKPGESLAISENSPRQGSENIARPKENSLHDLLARLKKKFFGKNSPFTSGETFDPEFELEHIRRAPKAERTKLLRAYKEKLAFQKEGLANMQEQLIQIIRANPCATVEQLYEHVKAVGVNYGLTADQEIETHELLGAYTEKHANVRTIREKYADDKELYQALFGREPKGNIQIIEGPMTLYVRCQDISDYAVIYSQSFLNGRDITDRDIQIAKMSGGVSIGTSLIDGLQGTLIVEKSEGERFATLNQGILDHEEQHAIKQMFGDTLREQGMFDRIWNAENEEERMIAIKGHLRWLREKTADERAKDEILAYFKGQNFTTKTIDILLQPKAEEGLYDYLDKQKVESTEWLVKNFGAYLKRGENESRPMIEKAVSEVYDSDYRALLKKSVEALGGLQETGYSKEKIIAILIQEPLSRWQKVVKRLLKQNGH